MQIQLSTIRLLPAKRILGFALSCTGIAVFWLIILPALARFAPIRTHIQRMDQADINVGAMFYTELNWNPPTGPVWR